MNSKTDKEDRSFDNIAFLSEIIADFRFWQEIFRWHSVKFGANLEHIINSAGVHRISMYLYLDSICLFPV
jgi:hypothetical protein